MQTLLTAGIICMVAAIVGGGVKLLGADVPIIGSVRRQAILFGVGAVFLAIGLVGGGTLRVSWPAISWPQRKPQLSIVPFSTCFIERAAPVVGIPTPKGYPLGQVNYFLAVVGDRKIKATAYKLQDGAKIPIPVYPMERFPILPVAPMGPHFDPICKSYNVDMSRVTGIVEDSADLIYEEPPDREYHVVDQYGGDSAYKLVLPPVPTAVQGS